MKNLILITSLLSLTLWAQVIGTVPPKLVPKSILSANADKAKPGSSDVMDGMLVTNINTADVECSNNQPKLENSKDLYLIYIKLSAYKAYVESNGNDCVKDYYLSCMTAFMSKSGLLSRFATEPIETLAVRYSIVDEKQRNMTIEAQKFYLELMEIYKYKH